MIYLVTDGSSYQDQLTGWAAFIVTGNGDKKLLYGGSNTGTVSRAELLPLLHGMSYIWNKIVNRRKGLPLTIISDSEYTVKVLSGLHNPSKNIDLWSAVNYLTRNFNVKCLWRKRNTHLYMRLVDGVAHGMRDEIKKIDCDHLKLLESVPSIDDAPLD